MSFARFSKVKLRVPIDIHVIVVDQSRMKIVLVFFVGIHVTGNVRIRLSVIIFTIVRNEAWGRIGICGARTQIGGADKIGYGLITEAKFSGS